MRSILWMGITTKTQHLWKTVLNLTQTNSFNQLMADYSTIRKISIKIIKMTCTSQMKNCSLKFSRPLNKKNFKETTEIRFSSNNKSRKFLQVVINVSLTKMAMILKRCHQLNSPWIQELKTKAHISKCSQTAEFKIHLLKSKLKQAKKACQETCFRSRWTNLTESSLIQTAEEKWKIECIKKVLQTNI